MPLRDPVQSVFEKELLLDNILKYVMQEKNEDTYNVSYANVSSCRLVSKAWMYSISRILRKCRKPLFRFYLHKENSLNTSATVVQNGKRLDNFVSNVCGTSSLEKQIPTFQITIFDDFFRQENYDSLLKCFTQCGGGLVDLEIWFPNNGGSLTFTFPRLTFPNLKNLNFMFMDDEDVDMQLDDGEAFVGSSNGVYFLQWILSGCEDLQSLNLSSYNSLSLFPYGLDRLILPSTLTTLAWFDFCELENKHYDLFVRNEFPKLKKLRFPIEETLMNGQIFKILDNVKTTLTQLSVEEERGVSGQSKYFHLPVMNKLKKFRTYSRLLTLEDGVSMLQNYVPNIQKLSLERQTTTMFRKWAESSRYVSVRELTINLESEDHSRLVSFQSPMMRLVEMAFPNIQTLKVTVCGTDLCGLNYAFQNLKTLQILEVFAEECENIVNSDCWDALLIGTPVEFATSLRTSRDVWSDVKFRPNIDHQSIKNLTELRKLDLSAYVQANSPLKEIPLISDVAFHFAFLNMPKLKELRLGGRFKVSSELMEVWASYQRMVTLINEMK